MCVLCTALESEYTCRVIGSWQNARNIAGQMAVLFKLCHESYWNMKSLSHLPRCVAVFYSLFFLRRSMKVFIFLFFDTKDFLVFVDCSQFFQSSWKKLEKKHLFFNGQVGMISEKFWVHRCIPQSTEYDQYHKHLEYLYIHIT